MKKKIRIIFLIIFSALFIFSSYKVFMYLKEYTKVKKEINSINEVINKEDNFMDSLKAMNSDVVSYIKIEGTNIDYPVVQTDNNDFYLKHTFDKSYSEYGWIFMDYRNEAFNNQNTIIYGHAMKNKTMFGSIKDMFKSSWLDNYKHEIKVYDNNEFVTYKIFSIYETEAVNDYLHTNFTSEEYKEFINTILKKSYYDFKTEVNEDSKMITLSTCSRQNKRLVVHAMRV